MIETRFYFSPPPATKRTQSQPTVTAQCFHRLVQFIVQPCLIPLEQIRFLGHWTSIDISDNLDCPLSANILFPLAECRLGIFAPFFRLVIQINCPKISINRHFFNFSILFRPDCQGRAFSFQPFMVTSTSFSALCSNLSHSSRTPCQCAKSASADL